MNGWKEHDGWYPPWWLFFLYHGPPAGNNAAPHLMRKMSGGAPNKSASTTEIDTKGGVRSLLEVPESEKCQPVRQDQRDKGKAEKVKIKSESSLNTFTNTEADRNAMAFFALSAKDRDSRVSELEKLVALYDRVGNSDKANECVFKLIGLMESDRPLRPKLQILIIQLLRLHRRSQLRRSRLLGKWYIYTDEYITEYLLIIHIRS